MSSIKCDIHNPGRAPRGIYDGITNEEKIVIDPGAVKSGVMLDERVVKRLQALDKADRSNQELVVTAVQGSKAPAPLFDEREVDRAAMLAAAADDFANTPPVPPVAPPAPARRR